MNQTAFLKGCNITDNAILVREVIHSFNSDNYVSKSFMLKAYASRAFDTVQWPFVVASLQAVNLLQNLIDLIMSCMGASRVKVLVNGEGQGFITLNWGLRQGCPLSLYLFILSMEFLTKHL